MKKKRERKIEESIIEPSCISLCACVGGGKEGGGELLFSLKRITSHTGGFYLNESFFIAEIGLLAVTKESFDLQL